MGILKMTTYTITMGADLTKLDAHFKDNLYVGGHSPNAEDLSVFNQYAESNTEPNQDSHANLWSWFALISLYTPQIKETWAAVVAKSAAPKKAPPLKRKNPKKPPPLMTIWIYSEMMMMMQMPQPKSRLIWQPKKKPKKPKNLSPLLLLNL